MATAHADGLPILSICIPTYNFGEFIAETLESILRQQSSHIEVVVLDSGSTDETPTIVSALQIEWPALRYVRTDMKLGIDRDLAHVVSLARGKYCWLFSADDVMNDGAIARVLSELETEEDVLLLVHSDDSISMKPLTSRHPVLALSSPRSFRLADQTQQTSYFSLAVTTESFFSFMGGLVVKKSTWDLVDLNEQFVGSCWAHVARLFELIPSGLTVRFIPEPMLRRRDANDSFASHGIVRRYALAIEGYLGLARKFWGDHSFQAANIRRVLRNEFGLRALWRAKSACSARPDREDPVLLETLVNDVYSDRTMSSLLTKLAFRLLPSGLYENARRAKAILRRVFAPRA